MHTCSLVFILLQSLTLVDVISRRARNSKVNTLESNVIPCNPNPHSALTGDDRDQNLGNITGLQPRSSKCSSSCLDGRARPNNGQPNLTKCCIKSSKLRMRDDLDGDPQWFLHKDGIHGINSGSCRWWIVQRESTPLYDPLFVGFWWSRNSCRNNTSATNTKDWFAALT